MYKITKKKRIMELFVVEMKLILILNKLNMKSVTFWLVWENYKFYCIPTFRFSFEKDCAMCSVLDLLSVLCG